MMERADDESRPFRARSVWRRQMSTFPPPSELEQEAMNLGEARYNAQILSEQQSRFFQHWLEKWGRWLFIQDRNELHTLSKEDRVLQRSVSNFQQTLKIEDPDQYFFLCLMSIPLEIRELIYVAKFDRLPQDVIIHAEYRLPEPFGLPHVLPPLCYVNRKIYIESVPVFVRNKSFTIDASATIYFAHILQSFPDRAGYRAITKMRLQQNLIWSPRDKIDENGVLDHLSCTWQSLVQSCPALQHLTLEVNSRRAVNELQRRYQARQRLPDRTRDCVPEESYAEFFKQMVDLEVILRLPRIKCFTLVCSWTNREVCEYELGAAQLPPRGLMTCFIPMVDWLRGEFTARKSCVQLEVKYHIVVKFNKEYVGFGPETSTPERIPRVFPRGSPHMTIRDW